MNPEDANETLVGRPIPRRSLVSWATGLGAICLLFAAWGLTYHPAPPQIAPDTPEAWRILLESRVPEERLAAALLLAAEGDDRATSSVLTFLSSCTKDQLLATLEFLSSNYVDKKKLSPALIRTFLSLSPPANPHWHWLIARLVPEDEEGKTAKSLSEPSPHRQPAVRPMRRAEQKALRTPWILRCGGTEIAMRDLAILNKAAADYMVDWSGFPPEASGLTSPVAYTQSLPADICAPTGPYGYSTDWEIPNGRNCAFVSTGSDGVRNISLMHLMLTRYLQGIAFGSPPPSHYVRWTPEGYKFLDNFAKGADVVQLFDRRVFDKGNTKRQ